MNPRTFDRVRRLLREANSEILGELAVAHGYVTPAQLDEVVREAEQGGATVVDRLVRRGLLTFDQVLELRDVRRRQDLDALAQPEPPPDEVIAAQGDPSRILGRYVLVEPVGRGGGGTVWRAWDGELRRWVALKRPREAVNEAFRQRFLREARVAASLRHPNLVAVHDAGEIDAQPFLVMEFVKGRPLDATGGPRKFAQILRKVALALAEAHRNGVVHRDIKPDNILVDERDEPHVVDFGLAHLSNLEVELTKPGVIIGTPLYMAPEQISGRNVSALSDVYALGAVLYQLLTGRVPFTGKTALDVCQKLLSLDPVPPRRLEPDAPPELEAICLKAIEKDPRRRYAGAVELAEDVDRWLQGLPVKARPASLPYLAWRRVRRHPLMWASGVAAVAALAASVIVTVRSWGAAQTISDELARETWAKELSIACAELERRTAVSMRELENRFHGAPTEMRPEDALRQVEQVATQVSARYPRLRAPRAWRGLALFYAGRDAEGLSEIESACVDGGDDPFPHLMMARARFTLYVQEANLHVSISELGAQVGVQPFVETPKLKELREAATAALSRALACRVWPRLDVGREYDLYAEATELLGRHEIALAAGKLAELRDDPALYGEAGFLEGLCRFSLQQYAESSDAWTRTCARRWPRSFYFRAVAHLKMATDAQARRIDPRGPLMETMRLLTAALELKPGYVEAYEARVLAGCILASVDASGAASHWDQAILDAASVGRQLRAGVFVRRGLAEKYAGRDAVPWFDKAIEELDEAVREPAGTRALLMRALVHLERAPVSRGPRESYESAVADYTQALKEGIPEEVAAVVLMNRGNAYLALAQRAGRDGGPLLDRAIRDYEEALKLQPGHAAVHCMRGQAWLSRSRFDADPWGALGSALEDFDRAVNAAFESAKTHDPLYLRTRSAGWLRKAELEIARNDDPSASFGKAIDDALEAKRVDPTNGINHFAAAGAYLARVEWKRGRMDYLADLQEIVTMCEAACQRRERFWEAYRLRGYAEVLRERPEDAIPLLERSLEINPNQPEVRSLLERLRP